MDIRKITLEEAFDFFYKNKERQITIQGVGNFYGYFIKEDLVGIISTFENKNKSLRIKTLLVKRSCVNKGIGTKLLSYIFDKTRDFSVFATGTSYKLFVKKGFKVVTEKKNNIKFMKYDGVSK